MIYCTGKTKSIVKVTWSSGEKITVESNSPPTQVVGKQLKNYSVSYYYYPFGLPGEDGIFVKSMGEQIAPVTLGAVTYSRPSQTQYGGFMQSDIAYTDGDNNIKSFTLTNNSVYGHTATNIRLVEGELFTRVTISDTKGKVYEKEYPGRANWVVTCDDDCPEGSHKCTHNKYPGYCCVPCKETGDRLKNLANKVGR